MVLRMCFCKMGPVGCMPWMSATANWIGKSGKIPASYQQRLDAILTALDDARAILTDPVRRFL